MLPASKNILDHLNIATLLNASAAPGSATSDRINLKDAAAAGVLLHVRNGGDRSAGSAITLDQHTAASAGSSADLGFVTYYYKLDTASSWTKGTASSDTFTTSATVSVNYFYWIPVDPATLTDTYKYLSVAATTGTGTTDFTLAAYCLLWPKLAGDPALFPNILS